MMQKAKFFYKDIISIEWVDKETLRYSEEGGRSALVWVDFEPGFFKRGRIIRMSSIKNWDERPGFASRLIDANDRAKIVDAIIAYYEYQNVPCRMEYKCSK